MALILDQHQAAWVREALEQSAALLEKAEQPAYAAFQRRIIDRLDNITGRNGPATGALDQIDPTH